MNILVLCTGNSARSILLESIFNHTSGGRITAYSAGSHPTGIVHPQSLALLGKMGHDTSAARSKSWDEFACVDAPLMDVVITVCGSAAGETCPIWPNNASGAPVRCHWGVDDPAAAKPADWECAFTTAYETLGKRAAALLDLPIETLNSAELKTALDRIGTL